MQVVGVKFEYNSRLYYFSCENLSVKKNMQVLCDTDCGIQYGTVKTGYVDVKAEQINYDITPILRIATKKDAEIYNKNSKDALIALKKCRDLAKKHKLAMKFVGAYYTFNREQLMFFFFADTRVDFRDLARILASIYKISSKI